MSPEDMRRLAGILRERANDASRSRVSSSYREGFRDGMRCAANVVDALSGLPADPAPKDRA